MKSRYQFGTRIFGVIFWRTVSQEKFAATVAPLMLQIGQTETIQPGEILPFFTHDFILRDGRKLYRAVPMGA